MSIGSGWKVLGWVAVLACMPAWADEAPAEPREPPACIGRWGTLKPAVTMPVIPAKDPDRVRVLELQRLHWSEPTDWVGHAVLERGVDGGRWQLWHYLGQEVFSGRPAPEYDDGCPADEDWRILAEVWTWPLGACPAADLQRNELTQAVSGFVGRFAQSVSAASEPIEPVEAVDTPVSQARYSLSTTAGPSLNFDASEDAQLTRHSERLLDALRACSATQRAKRVEVPGLLRLPLIEDVPVVENVVY